MTTDEEYEAAVLGAERELKAAKSADDVRAVWRSHMGKLGHRTLGRLLTGQSADRLLERRELRSARD